MVSSPVACGRFTVSLILYSALLSYTVSDNEKVERHLVCSSFSHQSHHLFITGGSIIHAHLSIILLVVMYMNYSLME